MGERCELLAERADLVRAPHPISLNQGASVVIPHPLAGGKSVCTTESFSPSHQKIYCREGSLGILIVEREPEARLNVGWRNWRVERRRYIKPHNTSSRKQDAALPPALTSLSTPGIYSCWGPGSPRETTEG